MNTTVFSGSPRARVALKEYVLTPGTDTDLCAGGDECRPWKKTKAGRARFEQLREQYVAQQPERKP